MGREKAKTAYFPSHFAIIFNSLNYTNCASNWQP